MCWVVLYPLSLLQVNCSHCQLFLWQVLQLQRSWHCAQMQSGCPTASKCFFFPPVSASPCHYMVSLCSPHYNNRIHNTELRNKEITYWQLMKQQRLFKQCKCKKALNQLKWSTCIPLPHCQHSVQRECAWASLKKKKKTLPLLKALLMCCLQILCSVLTTGLQSAHLSKLCASTKAGSSPSFSENYSPK